MKRLFAVAAVFSVLSPCAVVAYGDGPVVTGGNIPLARAAARLVPAGTTIAFGLDVDQAAFVRWTAGPSWQKALYDALAAVDVGVSFSIDGVRIGGAVTAFEPYLALPLDQAETAPLSREGDGYGGEDDLEARVATPAVASEGAGDDGVVAAQVRPAAPRSLTPQAGADAASRGVASLPESPITVQAVEPAAPAALPRTPDVAVVATGQPTLQPPAPAALFVPVLPVQQVPAEPVVARASWAVAGQTTLQATLETWAETAGWTVYYETPTQYELPAAAELHGSFEDAAARLVHLLRHRRPVPLLSLHPANKSLAVRSFASGGAAQ